MRLKDLFFSHTNIVESVIYVACHDHIAMFHVTMCIVVEAHLHFKYALYICYSLVLLHNFIWINWCCVLSVFFLPLSNGKIVLLCDYVLFSNRIKRRSGLKFPLAHIMATKGTNRVFHITAEGIKLAETRQRVGANEWANKSKRECVFNAQVTVAMSPVKPQWTM